MIGRIPKCYCGGTLYMDENDNNKLQCEACYLIYDKHINQWIESTVKVKEINGHHLKAKD